MIAQDRKTEQFPKKSIQLELKNDLQKQASEDLFAKHKKDIHVQLISELRVYVKERVEGESRKWKYASPRSDLHQLFKNQKISTVPAPSHTESGVAFCEQSINIPQNYQSDLLAFLDSDKGRKNCGIYLQLLNQSMQCKTITDLEDLCRFTAAIIPECKDEFGKIIKSFYHTATGNLQRIVSTSKQVTKLKLKKELEVLLIKLQDPKILENTRHELEHLTMSRLNQMQAQIKYSEAKSLPSWRAHCDQSETRVKQEISKKLADIKEELNLTQVQFNKQKAELNQELLTNCNENLAFYKASKKNIVESVQARLTLLQPKILEKQKKLEELNAISSQAKIIELEAERDTLLYKKAKAEEQTGAVYFVNKIVEEWATQECGWGMGYNHCNVSYCVCTGTPRKETVQVPIADSATREIGKMELKKIAEEMMPIEKELANLQPREKELQAQLHQFKGDLERLEFNRTALLRISESLNNRDRIQLISEDASLPEDVINLFKLEDEFAQICQQLQVIGIPEAFHEKINSEQYAKFRGTQKKLNELQKRYDVDFGKLMQDNLSLSKLAEEFSQLVNPLEKLMAETKDSSPMILTVETIEKVTSFLKATDEFSSKLGLTTEKQKTEQINSEAMLLKAQKSVLVGLKDLQQLLMAGVDSGKLEEIAKSLPIFEVSEKIAPLAFLQKFHKAKSILNKHQLSLTTKDIGWDLLAKIHKDVQKFDASTLFFPILSPSAPPHTDMVLSAPLTEVIEYKRERSVSSEFKDNPPAYNPAFFQKSVYPVLSGQNSQDNLNINLPSVTKVKQDENSNSVVVTPVSPPLVSTSSQSQVSTSSIPRVSMWQTPKESSNNIMVKSKEEAPKIKRETVKKQESRQTVVLL